jgi:hypothetical protein
MAATFVKQAFLGLRHRQGVSMLLPAVVNAWPDVHCAPRSPVDSSCHAWPVRDKVNAFANSDAVQQWLRLAGVCIIHVPQDGDQGDCGQEPDA